VQASGPYLIAGNSSGGLMAVQVARAFHVAGEPDGIIFLLDAPYHIRRNVLRLLLFLQRPLSRLLAGGRFGGHELLTLIRAVFDDEGLRVTLNALRHYRPRPYAGRALLFVPERRYRYFSALPWTGWRRRGNEQVTIQRVPGDHYTMHQPPHLEALAGLVRAAIAAFDD
jgi:thioesterase domain-containing protein